MDDQSIAEVDAVVNHTEKSQERRNGASKTCFWAKKNITGHMHCQFITSPDKQHLMKTRDTAILGREELQIEPRNLQEESLA